MKIREMLEENRRICTDIERFIKKYCFEPSRNEQERDINYEIEAALDHLKYAEWLIEEYLEKGV